MHDEVNDDGTLVSYAQRRLWFAQQLDPGSADYLLPLAVRLSGELDTDALERALTGIADRHEVLRTRFAAVDGEPRPRVDPPGRTRVHRTRARDAAELFDRELSRPMDLAAAPPVRMTLARLDSGDHLLLVVVHHIAVDGRSWDVLLDELAAGYRGEPVPVPATRYAEFARKQRERLAGPRLHRLLEHWRTRLAGLAPLDLPTDRPRPAFWDGAGDVVRFTVPAELVSRADELAKTHRVTRYMLLLAVYQALLAHYCERADIAVCTTLSDRTRPELAGLIGPFVNTVVQRTDLSGGPSFAELLGRVRETVLSGLSAAEAPFEQVVGAVSTERDLSRHPLAQASFTLVNTALAPIRLPGLTAELVPPPLVGAPMDVFLDLNLRSDGGLAARLQYATTLFDAATMRRFSEGYRTLLAAVLAAPTTPVADIAAGLGPLRATEEVPDSVAVAGDPSATAVVDDGRAVTYGELDAMVAGLAGALSARGVGRGDAVAVSVGRGVWSVAAMLAIWRAGGVYVPLDPALPPDRQRFMVSEVDITHVIADVGTDLGIPVVPVTETGPAAPAVRVHPNDLAYVIFTSGSSGRPKAVGVEHRALAAHVTATRRHFGFTAADRVLAFSSFSFDASLDQVLPALGSGATVVVRPDVQWLPSRLPAIVRDHGLTVLNLPPTYWSELAFALTGDTAPALRSLRLLILGGETVPPAALTAWRAHAPWVRVGNAYGPTETVVTATVHDVTEVSTVDDNVPIGRALGGRRTYVVDEQDRLAPTGELLIGGPELARGYLGRPALTAERFVPDAFGGTGGRLYRTGDLVRRRPDGELEFLGRVDDQVKVRGFRIELGEVDAALARCAGVRAAAAAVRQDAQGGRTLVGYVVGEAGGVRAECARWLPAHAVPTEIVPLDALPVNAAGKLDRAALPEAHQHRLEPGAGFTAPRDDTERAIAAIWSEVLGVEPISLDDSFFDLGGHSLLATMAVSRVAERLDRDVELRTLFENPRLRDFGPKVAAARVAGGAGIVPVDRRGPLPMSFAQERLWFLDRMSELGADYALWFSWRVTGPLDRAAWQGALDDVVTRHEVLRTALVERDGRPVQLVCEDVTVPLRWTEAADLDAVRAEATAFATARFDLAEPPLLRAGVWALGPEDHVVVLAFHHVATDGWSTGLVFAELAEAYAGHHVEPPAVQYGDYAVWQREHDTSAQLEYWRATLAGLSPLDLPGDRPRPAVRSGRGAAVRVSWPVPAGLDELAARCGATRFMVLLAVFQVVLGRWSGRTDVAVGTPVAGRGRSELERLVGFFVNTVVLRGDLAGDPTFAGFLDRVRDGVLSAFDHQDVPFEHLVRELRPERDLSRNPLFEVMFDLAESAASPAPAVDGLGFAPFTLPWQSAKFDLTANAVLHPERIDLDLEYSTDLFDEATVHRFAGWMHRTLVAVTADPDVRLGDVDLLSPGHREELLTWAGTGCTPPDPFLVGGAPDDVALVCGDDVLRYRELDERVGGLAAALVEDGVRPGTAVGVRPARGVAAVVAMLAVWRAGGVYVPLDPRFPARRLDFMVAEAGVERIIDGTERPAEPIGPRTPDPREAAYVIFTSGSSGRPKAVAVPHGALAAHVAAARECFGITAKDRVLSFASFSFDASFEQILPALSAGARVVLRPDEVWTPAELAERVRAEGVTVLELTPSYLAEVTAGADILSGLRLLVTGGEVLPAATLERWFDRHAGVPVVNTYGPTESVISTTAQRITGPGTGRVPIGRPLGGRRVYVTDARGALVPAGVPGELLVGGDELAHGYLGRPGATAERFVPDAFGGTGGRLYRTGDLVRWRPDATLEFLGRVDDQVQIRGFRVEPGEVEAVLREHPAVTDAAVVVRDVRGEPALVAYVAGAGDLREWCANRLPGYLVPAVFTALETLPRTVPGKLDVAALPDPDVPVVAEFEAPETPTETVTAQIWAEVLGVARVGRHEDFFALGGHSLRAVAVAARLRAAFGCPVPVRDLFEHPTVARLAARVEDRLVAEIAAMSDDEIDLSLTVDHRN
ncbi:pyoverdine biosynthesis protein PvdJ [Amycolatopsis sp. NBRC 101858]|uniref:non-ribosomal peptide synthetase n=1 Tax=Amycolatopsis sp. NBRC 101858 TaxID=3032200 RepID=UPI0024A53762|nr:non-ribosomal peptide synthetase [Amycolatopsis sp. NBRC 101858]GLY38116.1 pyoverdine biosynthesis protein PvdJ [Amycolatopsis sp. NBRC 101858]